MKSRFDDGVEDVGAALRAEREVREHGPYGVMIGDEALTFRPVIVEVAAPTGRQILEAAHVQPLLEHLVFQILADGMLKELRPDETADLRKAGVENFVVFRSDRSFRFELNGRVYEWGARTVTGLVLKTLARVDTATTSVCKVSEANARQEIDDHEVVDLTSAGVERFVTHPREWKLNVQGVVLTVHQPTIVVRDAIKDAGFDPTTPWIMVLRIQGQKREVGLNDVIDLRAAGIEKLRLTPKEVINGEAPMPPRRMFDLLEVDERFLNASGLRWETIIDTSKPSKSRRWLLVHDYLVPIGFTAESTILALEIPLTYPRAQIDMFYTYPPLALKSGRAIPNTDVSQVIQGITFNRWSRHRGQQSPWQPATDNVATHLALVESAMVKETGA